MSRQVVQTAAEEKRSGKRELELAEEAVEEVSGQLGPVGIGRRWFLHEAGIWFAFTGRRCKGEYHPRIRCLVSPSE